ncbi:MAG: DoxX family protein [Deltaproteobacteria bacterium]|nr:DoxX family protein [Deltaproteobacteria bacterium]
MFKTFVKTDKSGVQLLLRLALAVVMFPHGAQKVFGWFGGPGHEKTIEAFADMGFPIWATVALMVTELVGPALLALGYLTRLWAFAMGTAITICMFINHVEHGFFMNWLGRQKGEGFEYHILVIAIALALLIGGGGAMSIDRQLGSGGRRHRFTV